MDDLEAGQHPASMADPSWVPGPASAPTSGGTVMDTRTIAVLALVIAVIVLLVILL